MRTVAVKICLLTCLFVPSLAFEARAAMSDPNTVVEDSHRVDNSRASETVINRVTREVKTKVKDLWESAKGIVSKPSPSQKTKQIAGDSKPATKKKAAAPVVVDKTQQEIKSLAETMPRFHTEDKGFNAKDLEKARKSIAPGITRVVEKSTPAQADLERNKSGVPVYPMFDVKKQKDKAGKIKTVYIPKKVIPKLNVGKEARISKNDFLLPNFKLPLAAHSDPKPLKSPNMVPGPEISRFSARPFVVAEKAKDIEGMKRGIDKVVTREMVDKIVWHPTPEKPLQLKPYKPLSENQQKMLAALILYQKGGQCHFVIGLFDQLSQGTDSNSAELKDEARFHLGACSHSMKLYSSSFAVLSKLIGEKNPEYTKDAIDLLASDLPEQYEAAFYHMLKDLKENKWVSDKSRDRVNYLAAKGAFKTAAYKAAKDYAQKVQEKSPDFAKAQYLVGISDYSLGNKKAAVAKLEGLRAWMADKKIGDKNLNSLTALNLARIQFNTGSYKEAFDLYMKVDKDHPSWVQALIEQGWTQLSMGDYSGAIGNMYSLHSPYFTAVYKPESFVVRSIGYLNICQYGDAYKTLSYLEKDYRDWYSSAGKYVQTRKLASDYHSTVVNYLKGKSDQNIDGLPFQIVREMARQKFYLNKQVALNETLDEMQRHKGLNEKIKEEKASIRWKLKKSEERLAQVRAAITKAKADKTYSKDGGGLEAQFRNERDFIIGYRYQLGMLELGRQGFLAFREKSEDRIGKEQYVLREAAGRFLVSYLAKIQKEMSQILDNNEFLRYEVFAGAGENIRYQVAGGQVNGEPNRVPASMKPQKIMNWSFDGEYWEDEIGSYRSSLQNLCLASGKAQSYYSNEKDQASLSKEYVE